MNVRQQIALLYKIVKTSHSFNPKITWYEILNGLCSAFYRILNVVMPAQIINLMVGGSEWEIILLWSVFYGISISLLGAGTKSFKLLQEAHGFKNCNLFRLRMNQKFMKLDYEDTENSEVIDRFEQAKDSMWEFTDVGYVVFIDLLGNIISFVTMSYIIASMNPWIYLVVFVAVLGITYLQHKKNQMIHDSELKEKVLDKNLSYISNLMQNIPEGKEIRLYHLKDYLSAKFQKQAEEVEEHMAKREKKVFRYQIGITCIRFGQLLGIYLAALQRYGTGLLPIGSFLMYIGAVEQLAESVKNLLDAGIELSRVSLYYQDYETYMNVPESLALSGKENLPSEVEGFQFSHVSYAYPNTGNYAVKDISFHLSCGDKVAIVGENGAGKTTLIKLILRLYEPTEGVITLNGRDIREYKYEEYLQVFSTVFQDFSIFAYSIQENIIFDRELDQEKLDILLEKVDLHKKIEKYPQGLDTYVSKELSDDGVNLSGGEQQLVAIARAFYRDSRVLILDEPTAALDPIKEAEIYQLIDNLSKDKMKIYCSHRMSSTKFCNRILVFEHGNLVEQGSHTELMKNLGTYYTMFTNQAVLYRDIS